MLQKFFSVTGWIMGLVGLYIGLISYVEGDPSKNILYKTRTDLVWRQTLLFDIAPIYHGEQDLKSNTVISKTLIAIWNGGKNVIKDEDVRTPLVIKFSEGRLYDVKVLEKISVVSDNFSVVRVNADEIVIKWKVFDPGMAIQIAVLHNGVTPPMSVTGSLGPRVNVRAYESINLSQGVLILIGVLIGIYIANSIVDRFMKTLLTPESVLRNSGLSFLTKMGVAIIMSLTVCVFFFFLSSYISAILFADMSSPININVEY